MSLSKSFFCGFVNCPFPPLERNVLPERDFFIFSLVASFDIGFLSLILKAASGLFFPVQFLLPVNLFRIASRSTFAPFAILLQVFEQYIPRASDLHWKETPQRKQIAVTFALVLDFIFSALAFFRHSVLQYFFFMPRAVFANTFPQVKQLHSTPGII